LHITICLIFENANVLSVIIVNAYKKSTYTDSL